MPEADLEILQDPDHPEGGHVILRFRGVATIPDDPRFVIEAIGGMAPAQWPDGLQQPVATRLSAEALEIVAGAEIGNEVPPGVPVSVSVPGARLSAERLWPSITPMIELRAPKARVVRPAKPVVAPAAGQKSRVAVVRPEAPKPEVPKEEPRREPEPPRPPEKGQAVAKPGTPETADGSAAARKQETPRPVGKSLPAAKAADARPRARVALAALVGLILGVGSVLAYVALGGRLPGMPAVVTAASPISLYDLLAVKSIPPQDLSVDRLNSSVREHWDKQPRNSDEAAYWLKQVVAREFTKSQVDALTRLGVLQYDQDRNPTGAESARLLWEIAAAREGCNALLNLGYLGQTETGKTPEERRQRALW